MTTLIPRDAWMGRLAEAVRPRSPRPTAIALGRMLQFLVDVPEHAFTDDSLQYCATRLRKTPSLPIMRDLLAEYLREQDPAPVRDVETPTMRERRKWEERQAFLRRDWDDPAGILRKVRNCGDDMRWLRSLASLVAKWAPQHLGLLPPHVLEAMARDPEVTAAPFVELRMRLGDPPRPYQPGNLDEPARVAPRAAYLPEADLNALNPGRSGHVSPPSPVADRSADDTDPAAPDDAQGHDEQHAAYPAR